MFLNKKMSNLKDLSNNNNVFDEEYDGNDRDRDVVTYKDIDPTIINQDIPIKERNTKVFFVIQCCYCKSKFPNNSNNTLIDKLKYLFCFFWCPCYVKLEE